LTTDTTGTGMTNAGGAVAARAAPPIKAPLLRIAETAPAPAANAATTPIPVFQ
jgi:hypothetical protein